MYLRFFKLIFACNYQVGGVQTVTLGDEQARARGTQKSVLERKAPSTFPLLIEMRERSHWVAHQVRKPRNSSSN
jgi:hypothetical protein